MNDQSNNINNAQAHRDEDEESALTTIDNNEPIGQINLDEYCISSDADTEKMGSDILHEEEELHPKLSDLLTSTKHKLEEEEEEEDVKEEVKEEESNKKIKLEEPVKEEEEPKKEEDKEEEDMNEGDREDVEDEEEVEEEVVAVVNEPNMPSPMEMENKRLEAMDDIISIEYKFATLRQRLYENKLSRLEIELQMCLEGSHPELHGYYEKISNIRDYKLKRAYQRQKYELMCIDKETRATRTMIHQDYFKKVSDLKRKLLTSTTREWYDINKERREMDTMIPDVSYHVPVKIMGKTLSCITGYAGAAQQRLPGEPLSEDMECENINFKYRNNPVDKLEVIVDRMRLNNQLSDLEGLKRFYSGFPGAPGLNGLRDSEITEDFETMQMLLQSGH
ncbi:transcriptional regulatory protein Dep1p [Monosporozyma unispora]